jgi:transcriptional regulator with XRE-family HTH domain
LFAHAIRSARESRSLSLHQVRERTGLGRSTLGYWERGEKAPDLASLARFCHGLGLSKSEHGRFIDAMIHDLLNEDATVLMRELGASPDEGAE